MDAGETRKSHLNVQRFQAQHLVSSEHPSPESVKSRLDEATAKSLPGTLSSVLSGWFSLTDPSIWLIRRLELEIDVNAAWDREQLARCWASQIARVLTVTMQGSGDGQNVLRFENRPSYLARFVVDLANGRAWGKWYYESFDGLRMLPVSAALRTAIGDEPSTGLAALLELPRNELTRVLRTLTVQDARRILERISEEASKIDEIECFQALWIKWETAELELLDTDEEWRNALRLYLNVCRDKTELSGPALKTATLALLRLTRRLANGSASQNSKLIAALIAGDLSALYSAAGPGDAEVLAPLIRCPPDWVKEVGQTLLSRYGDQMATGPVPETERRYTPFGGIFLLLPFLDVLPLERATEGWPDAENASAATLVRFLVLVKCYGQARAHRVFFDALVRDLMGIHSALCAADVARWQALISQANLVNFLEEFSTWQRESGAVNGRTLVLARASLASEDLAVLLDCQRGVWLYGTEYHPHRLDDLIEKLRPWLSYIKKEVAVLISEDVFVHPLRVAFPHITVIERHSHSATRSAEEDHLLAGVLARLDKLPDDLSYLALPKLFGMSHSVDLALSVAAQDVMRAFAWRLPGFAESGLPYLHSNFLDFGGSVEDEPARRVVRIGRPPLNLVLNMTGMARKEYRLSWLDERPFTLFQEG